MQTPNHARPALIAAFAEAMMQERFSRLQVGHICAAAGVGRTTFYLHFRNLDDLLMAVVAPLIDEIAAGLVTGGAAEPASAVLQHVWEQRRQSELWRDPGFRARFTAALAARLETARASPLGAAYVAAGVSEVLQQWTAGRIRAQPDALLIALRRLSAGLRDDDR